MAEYFTYGSRDRRETERELRHRALAREAASEGMVLLKNEGMLPLKPQKISLYGAGARMTVSGGTGSGDMNSRRNVSIEQGLMEAGYEIVNSRWLDRFDKKYSEKRQAWKDGIEEKIKDYTMDQIMEMFGVIFDSEPFRFPVGDLIRNEDLSEETKTAIYIIARQAGECADRKVEPGDFLLDGIEKENLRMLTKHYENVMVVINCGGIMDLSFIEEIPGINAVMFCGQGGTECGNAFADLLSGKRSPSGKLADTWGMRYEDYPQAEDYRAITSDSMEEDYKEGIYVGYRYFSSYGVKPRYSFGYGLSYTTFSYQMINCNQENRNIKVLAEVENTGDTYRGKEVLQLYVKKPWGRLDHEARSLVAFSKTRELLPGEKEALTLTIPMRNLASYDEERGEWFLEKGEYGLYLGTSLETAQETAVFIVEKETVIEKNEKLCQPPHPVITEPPKAEAVVYDSELPRYRLETENLQCQTHDYKKPEVKVSDEIKKMINSLSDKELASLCVGGNQFENAYHITPGAVGWTTMDLIEKGIPNVNFADGPAGLRLETESVVEEDGTKKYLNAIPEEQRWGCLRKMEPYVLGNPDKGTVIYQFMTAWPAEHVQAQTWNVELLQKIGEAVGEEMLETGVGLWLAPAMNIHRNPLCGRNFEYYSEDPYLSACMAAAVTDGVQNRPGVGVTIKHFCCNNRETNRNYISENVSERALREIYLSGFRYVIENAHPKAVMSSYNRVNGTYAVNHYDLLIKILRCEWKYEGLIMSDWGSTGDGKGLHEAAPGAGNDLIMPGGPTVTEALERALQEKKITRRELEWNAAHVLNMIFDTFTTKKIGEER